MSPNSLSSFFLGEADLGSVEFFRILKLKPLVPGSDPYPGSENVTISNFGYNDERIDK